MVLVLSCRNREQAWLPRLSLVLPTQQPAQLGEAPTLPGSALGRFDWHWGQNKVGWRSRTAVPCGALCHFRDTKAGFLQWPFGSWVCFREGIMSENSLNAVLTVPFSGVSSFTVELLTPWKMQEVMFLTSVNRWEVACSGRLGTSLAVPLRWALSLELCLFVMSVRKSFEKEQYRHPLIRFLQGDLFSSPLMA